LFHQAQERWQKIKLKQKPKIMKTIVKSLFLALSLLLVVVSMSNAKPGRPAVSTFKTGIYHLS
jgi:hypothetical protein